MQIRSTQKWDDAFFSRFLELRCEIYQTHPDFLPETLEDLRLFFGDDSAFAKKMHWKAVLIERKGRLYARYLVSMHPQSEKLSLGFFELVLDETIPDTSVEFVQVQIFSTIKEFQQRFPQLREVQGPIQGSIFAGSRFREPTAAPRFLGESLHQELYPRLWERWGFQRGEAWESFDLPIPSGKAFFKSAGEKLQRLWEDPRILCRPLRREDWDHEVAAIFKITHEAYQLENTNDEIDAEIFAALSKKIRPLVEAGIVKILEYDGKAVGFTICYIDIQSALRRYNQRKKLFSRWGSFLNTCLLVWDIKMKRHPLLLFYIAKSPRCPVKWAMMKLACSALEDITPEKYPQVISALNAESSGSRSSLPPDKVFHSRHYLMTLDLKT